MGQATEDAVASVRQHTRTEILQTQIQSAGQRGMNGRNVRPPFLPAGERGDFRLRMAEQNLDQLQSRIAGRTQNADAYHVAFLGQSSRRPLVP